MSNETLHLNKKRTETTPAPSDKTDGQLDIELRLHGKRFIFRFDIPDALGTVMATDVDRQRMLARVMDALDGRFGKLRLRAEL